MDRIRNRLDFPIRETFIFILDTRRECVKVPFLSKMSFTHSFSQFNLPNFRERFCTHVSFPLALLCLYFIFYSLSLFFFMKSFSSMNRLFSSICFTLSLSLSHTHTHRPTNTNTHTNTNTQTHTHKHTHTNTKTQKRKNKNEKTQ